MKYLKALLIAIITVFTFGSAMAQAPVRVVHHPVRRHWYHRHHPWHRRRVVVVHH